MNATDLTPDEAHARLLLAGLMAHAIISSHGYDRAPDRLADQALAITDALVERARRGPAPASPDASAPGGKVRLGGPHG